MLNEEPVIIEVKDDATRIVITDGFHFTQPIKLKFKEPSYYYFKVVCALDDIQLVTGSLLLAVLYILGFLTNIFLIKLFSFLPIVYFLFVYYINRKEFIKVIPA